MLVQSSLPSSIEADLSFVSDHGKQDLLCDWISSGESCQKRPKCFEHLWDGEQSSAQVEIRNASDSHSLAHSGTCSKLSSVTTMCASSAPNFVYKRRKLPRNSVTFVKAGATYSRRGKKERKRSDTCLPSICSAMPSESSKKDDHPHSRIKYESVVIGLPVMTGYTSNKNGNKSIREQPFPQKVYKKRKLSSQKLDVPFTGSTNVKNLESKSNNGCLGREEQGSEEALNNTVRKSALGHCSCSSSKSNIELVSSSMKTDIDDIGECSSSDILTTDLLGGSLSEKEKCISVLRSHGLIERTSPVKDNGSIDVRGIDGNSYHSCKICGDLGNSLKMLICDNCEEAFHVFCCNPKLKKAPLDEWYCQPCLRKKRKLSRKTAMLHRKDEVSQSRSRTTKGELGHISFMLKDTESYTTGVRIGKAFQADVPDWTSQVSTDVDCIGEPTKMDDTDSGSLYGWNANKSFVSSSIGNWLQCREVLDDDTGSDTICGKWRRAPLFEVQTDDWDCSCSVIWDPVHSDCAVPQELDTDQVLMHLKYIEMLRPRLAAKKQNLTRSKSNAENVISVTSKDGDS